MEKYKILWTDMHSNLHHEPIKELPKWIEQMKKTMDFWPFAYYPYAMQKHESGLGVEDKYPLEERKWTDLSRHADDAMSFHLFNLSHESHANDAA